MDDILLGMTIREKNKFTPLTIKILICDLTPKAMDCANLKKKKEKVRRDQGDFSIHWTCIQWIFSWI